jgi:hypothetical protein
MVKNMSKTGANELESHLISEIITVIHTINSDLVDMPRKMNKFLKDHLKQRHCSDTNKDSKS